MITLPTSSQLLEAIRLELRENVSPAVADPVATDSLAMTDALLASIAIRCDHEVAWMQEELEHAEAVAEAVLGAGVDHDGRVGAALAELRAADGVGDRVAVADARARYDLASRLLSHCIEAALPVGGELRTQVTATLAERLAHETEIRGDFSLSGRT